MRLPGPCGLVPVSLGLASAALWLTVGTAQAQSAPGGVGAALAHAQQPLKSVVSVAQKTTSATSTEVNRVAQAAPKATQVTSEVHTAVQQVSAPATTVSKTAAATVQNTVAAAKPAAPVIQRVVQQSTAAPKNVVEPTVVKAAAPVKQIVQPVIEEVAAPVTSTLDQVAAPAGSLPATPIAAPADVAPASTPQTEAGDAEKPAETTGVQRYAPVEHQAKPAAAPVTIPMAAEPIPPTDSAPQAQADFAPKHTPSPAASAPATQPTAVDPTLDVSRTTDQAQNVPDVTLDQAQNAPDVTTAQIATPPGPTLALEPLALDEAAGAVSPTSSLNQIPFGTANLLTENRPHLETQVLLSTASSSTVPSQSQSPAEPMSGAPPLQVGATGGAFVSGAGAAGTLAQLAPCLLFAAIWAALWLIARLRPAGITLPNLAPPG